MSSNKHNVIDLFCGCGGLSLGFEQAGYNVLLGIDNWEDALVTFRYNHHNSTTMCADLMNLDPQDVQNAIGGETVDVIIGGPPCQSWSLAGAMKGIKDSRGQLLYDYVRLIESKEPKFFLAENVPGMVCKTHLDEFEKFKEALKDIGYNVSFQVLNANDYEVPQDRKRVFLVGLHESLNKEFQFPEPITPKLTLKDAIGDLSEPLPAYGKNKANPFSKLDIPNHEYMTGDFSTIYMSRNRVRKWDEPSFTIQAGGRHAPCHPQANPMIKVEKDKRIFDPESPNPYRRLSVRECARIQTFPDDFIFYYKSINDGYKMIGNAVPVKLAENIAIQIKKVL